MPILGFTVLGGKICVFSNALIFERMRAWKVTWASRTSKGKNVIGFTFTLPAKFAPRVERCSSLFSHNNTGRVMKLLYFFLAKEAIVYEVRFESWPCCMSANVHSKTCLKNPPLLLPSELLLQKSHEAPLCIRVKSSKPSSTSRELRNNHTVVH